MSRGVLARAGASVDRLLPWMRRTRLLAELRRQTRPDLHWMELGTTFVRYRARIRPGRPTLVLTPDPPIVLEHYDAPLSAIGPDHSVVVLEPPGSGFSLAKPDFGFDFDAWIETLDEFLERLGAGPYVLAFPCVSGFAAVAQANRRKDICGIIAIQTPCWAAERRWVLSRSRYGVLTVPVWGQLLLMALKRRRASRLFPALAQKRIDELSAVADAALARGSLFPFATAAQSYLTERPPEMVRPTAVPAIAVWGEADRSHAALETRAESIHELLPNCPIHRIPDAGHFPELETPEPFAALVTQFLTRLGVKASWATT